MFEDIKKETSDMAKLKKQHYYRNKIKSKNGDMKAIYNVLNKEMDRKQDCQLPDSADLPTLAKDFNDFFIKKIENIRKNFSSVSNAAPSEDLPPGYCLENFAPCDIEELQGIINDSGIKCSPSDFIPTDLLKEHVDIFLPTLCELVNLSLSTGSMDGLKVADVIPTIKGLGIDPNNMKNYRPISNLTFLGKLVERVVLKRLNEHMDRNNLSVPEQSAYRKHHSTETILVKVTNDLLIAADNNSATVLMLLDLSAAFDTVDHKILIKILKNEINMQGTALKWFKSFLSGRCQRVRLGSSLSDEVTLLFGVPQGSVLGPVLFNIYIRSLYGTIKKQGFNVQGYADDHQVYKTFKPIQQSTVLTVALQNCFSTIQHWMCEYCLQLNPGKTQLIVFGAPNVLKNIHIHGTYLTPGVCVRFVSTAKNLGITFDVTLSFKTHVLDLKKNCFRLLRQICKLRFLFETEQIKLIVNSLVVCKLDYCNSLYYGITEALLDELQHIQNAAGKAVYGLYKHDHVGDTLQKLHWLPVRERIIFKVLLLVYKTLTGKGPQYLSEMLTYTNFSHCPYLKEPSVKNKFGERAFSKVAPKLWNDLPQHLKDSDSVESFKTSLKSHLFKNAFQLP